MVMSFCLAFAISAVKEPVFCPRTTYKLSMVLPERNASFTAFLPAIISSPFVPVFFSDSFFVLSIIIHNTPYLHCVLL